MTLALDDLRWSELAGSYGGTQDVVAWLTEGYEKGLSNERLGDIINEVQHQGDTSTAMYAVVPHLIALASFAPPKMALQLLIHAGLIHADAAGPFAVPCPSFLVDDFATTATGAAKQLVALLLTALSFEEFKDGVAALAGLTGHHAFGRLLSGLDLYKGQFYHTSLEKPFPTET